MTTIHEYRISYEAHKKFLEMVRDGAEAELEGYCDAELLSSPRGIYQGLLRGRYLQGFSDGMAKIKDGGIHET